MGDFFGYGGMAVYFMRNCARFEAMFQTGQGYVQYSLRAPTFLRHSAIAFANPNGPIRDPDFLRGPDPGSHVIIAIFLWRGAHCSTAIQPEPQSLSPS
jgi:hypothetical protein